VDRDRRYRSLDSSPYLSDIRYAFLVQVMYGIKSYFYA